MDTKWREHADRQVTSDIRLHSKLHLHVIYHTSALHTDARSWTGEKKNNSQCKSHGVIQ